MTPAAWNALTLGQQLGLGVLGVIVAAWFVGAFFSPLDPLDEDWPQSDF